ncbi:hypothetical protein Patl1_16010 [Pistacia atlantica]|uniref:Uncharacterized protein n=1 Tax=Pistacia atlantica TaxID=434234 RepID=A0ACC1BAK3_9ROSI|nr:hypothetical protein Patl1_16010 [Pistacia atlantica]
MRHHPETNPYFYSQQHSQLPTPTPTPTPQHESPQHQEPHPQTEPSGMTATTESRPNSSNHPMDLATNSTTSNPATKG